MHRWAWIVIVGCSSDPMAVSADAAPDAASIDTDMDGIEDSVDLCPGFASPDNHDHDGDQRGDACDPCPHLPSNVATLLDNDGDGDGVGDGCDPRPAQASERRGAFYGFYDQADIAGWETSGGTWTVSGGKVTIDALTMNVFTLSPTVFAPDIVVTASVDVQAVQQQQVSDKSGGILVRRSTPTVMYHRCLLNQRVLTAAEVRYQIVNEMGTGGSSTTPYDEVVVADAHDYKFGFAASVGTCGVDGLPYTFTQNSGAPAQSQVGISAEQFKIAVDYIFVVEAI